MNFYGKRVVLRAIERADLEALARFHNDPAIAGTLEFGWPISMAAQERFFERNAGDDRSKRLVIETKEFGVIGYTGLWGIDWVDRRATNGIIIGRPEAQGRGYATDAIWAVMRAAFDYVGLHRLDAEIFEFNQPSLKLYLGRCGWREEGRRRQHVFRDGRHWDRVLVGITRDEYRSKAEAEGYWSDG